MVRGLKAPAPSVIDSVDRRDFGAIALADDEARGECVEPLLRIYTESCSKEAVARLLEAGRAFAMGA